MIYCPLVGTFFRKGATEVLAYLPAHCELKLQPEPQNPVDGEAIKVLLDPVLIPEDSYEELQLKLAGFGLSLDEILQQEDFFLGYIASSRSEKGRKAISEVPGAVGNSEALSLILEYRDSPEYEYPLCARLGFAPNGKPLVLIAEKND